MSLAKPGTVRSALARFALGWLSPEYREAQGNTSGEYRAPEHHAGEHPQQQGPGRGPECQRQEGCQERSREQRGLQRQARDPVALPPPSMRSRRLASLRLR
jgi:hypothetical protein